MFAAIRDVYRRNAQTERHPLESAGGAPAGRRRRRAAGAHQHHPNQVTLATLLVFLGGAALMALVPRAGAR